METFMRHLLIATILASTFAISACQATVRSPDVKVKTDGGTEIEIGDDQNNGKFCPPGQAKKGNC